MKTKLILTAFIFSFSLLIKAQLFITADSYQEAVLNNTTKDWDLVSNKKEVSIFQLDMEMTTLMHSVKGSESVTWYTIKKWEFDDEKSTYFIVANTMDDDVEYLIGIDGINMMLSIMTEKKGVQSVIGHNIVDIKFEE